MATADDLTTLVCLFHHQDQARAAVQDLNKNGISQADIKILGNGDIGNPSGASLRELGIPDRDCKHILEGLRNGGTLVSVLARSGEIEAVERAFGHNKAKLIDEADTDKAPENNGSVIPIVEEELVVGKRTVDQGGVRVYRRIVEIPVDESITLHEEHVNVQRHAVDRPATDADLALQGDRTIDLIETAEEAVIGKSARVVEEVLVGKSQSERTEHVHDTVRHTEVSLEEIEPEVDSSTAQRKL